MNTKIAGLLVLLLLSSGAGALGFGDIRVNSFLNEPLDARIELVSITPDEAEGLRIALASVQDFADARLIRPSWLNQLRFNPVAGDDHQVFIHVTTQEGIREPFLNFLLEFVWGENRLLREFTLLLNPPPADVMSARTGERSRAEALPASGSVTMATEHYGPVKPSETLWVIAASVRPKSSATVEQMMMALLRANPDAFQHDNVNFLKRGTILEIPDQGVISELSAVEARRAFQQQNKEWKSLKSASSRTAPEPDRAPQAEIGRDQPVTATETGLPTPAADDQSGKLRVVPVGEAVEVAGSQVAAEASAPAATDLSIALESSRKDLEAVLEINRDLVVLKNALELKIEALRRSLEERNRSVDQLAQQLARMKIESAAATAAAVVVEKKPADVVQKSDVAEAVAEPKVNATAPEPIVNRPAQADWLDRVGDYWSQLLLVLLSFLVVILLWLWSRRRKQQRQSSPAELFASYVDEDGQPATEERLLINPKEVGKFRRDRENDPPGSDLSLSAKVDVASVLTDADIYLAYRRYGQAEALLKQSIAINPNNMTLKAKLLEIYAFRKDRKKFVTTMEEVYQPMIAQSPELWAKVQEMGRTVAPDHELIESANVADGDAELMINDLSVSLSESSESNRNRRVDSGNGHQ
ncbi:MAG: hypothetical protein KDI83_02435 [Gammaproteobacteria bacterium]|nr:hypothetical protein [Gammaproteobacteria bacterium]